MYACCVSVWCVCLFVCVCRWCCGASWSPALTTRPMLEAASSLTSTSPLPTPRCAPRWVCVCVCRWGGGARVSTGGWGLGLALRCNTIDKEKQHRQWTLPKASSNKQRKADARLCTPPHTGATQEFRPMRSKNKNREYVFNVHAGITSGSWYIIRWREPCMHFKWLLIFSQVERATQAFQVARYV
jgi:hypothetical protein